MVDSRSGPRGHGEHSARAGGPRADLPGFTDDDRAVVDLLATLSPLTAPDADARARMRARVMAGLAESPKPAPSPRPIRSSGAGRAPRGRRSESAPSTRPEPARAGSGARARFAVASIAVLALVFSLAGMSLLLARDALPGDALYAVKRTGEAASLGLTFSDENQAFKHLEFATARLTEIETLTQRYQHPDDGPVRGYVSALSDFDNDAAAGSRQLIALATGGDGALLDALRMWARTQGARLDQLAARLPAAATIRQSASTALLREIEARASALSGRIDCYQVTSGSIDDIGALPATTACERRPDAPAVAPSTKTTTATVVAPPAATTVMPPAAPVQPTQPGTGEPGASAQTSTPLLSLPPLIGGPPTTSSTRPSGDSSPTAPAVTVPLPLPLPTIAVPPLLGLPGVQLR